jgi:hypothetical protein
MLHNTARNINLAPLTFWSNNWGVLYTYPAVAEAAAYKTTVVRPGRVIANNRGFAVTAFPTPPTTPETVVNIAVCE